MKRVLQNRRGFTLLELVVATTVSAVIFLGAGSIYRQIGDTSARLSEDWAEHLVSSNGDRFLRWTLLQAEASVQRFSGRPWAVTFGTWCTTSGGWAEPCEARLALQPGSDGRSDVTLQAGRDRRPITVVSGLPSGRFLYLVDPAYGGEWAPSWDLRLSLPTALGIAAGPDTMIYRVGIGTGG